MTATTAYSHQFSALAARRVRPHGIDLAVMRISLALLLWARRRADRAALTSEEHGRIFRDERALQARQHQAALLIFRMH